MIKQECIDIPDMIRFRALKLIIDISNIAIIGINIIVFR